MWDRSKIAGLLSVVLMGAITSTAAGQLKRVTDPIAENLEPTRVLIYKTVGARELKLHAFEPDGHQPGDRRPVFLAIHGGGWTGGAPRQFYPLADWFRKLGMVGISLEYRLMDQQAGTTVFDCVKDGRSAVRYLRQHAEELGIDPQRIAVAGGSAGGHVAVGTALFDSVDEPGEDANVSCRPDALVLYYPVIDTSADGYGQKKIGDRWQELSPVDHVRPGLPPTIVFQGTGDTVTPYRGAVEFWNRMQSDRNKCELITQQGGRHGYLIFDLQLYKREMNRTEQFLREIKLLK